MGTKSCIVFIWKGRKWVISVGHDGYFSGVGKELAAWIAMNERGNASFCDIYGAALEKMRNDLLPSNAADESYDYEKTEEFIGSTTLPNLCSRLNAIFTNLVMTNYAYDKDSLNHVFTWSAYRYVVDFDKKYLLAELCANSAVKQYQFPFPTVLESYMRFIDANATIEKYEVDTRIPYAL